MAQRPAQQHKKFRVWGLGFRDSVGRDFKARHVPRVSPKPYTIHASRFSELLQAPHQTAISMRVESHRTNLRSSYDGLKNVATCTALSKQVRWLAAQCMSDTDTLHMPRSLQGCIHLGASESCGVRTWSALCLWWRPPWAAS